MEALRGHRQQPFRLGFIDGLRGVAALVVCVGHLAKTDSDFASVSSLAEASGAQWLIWPLHAGFEMVMLFLFLSALSLSWSETSRRAAGRAASTLPLFAARRAWRILPTYYVALALGLVVCVGLPEFELHEHSELGGVRPVTWTGVASHLFFVQNLSPDWSMQINAPLWSMAWEVQLYLIFPLLYWLMRGPRSRLSLVASIAVLEGAIALGVAPVYTSLLVAFILGCYVPSLTTNIMPRARPVLLGAGAALLATGLLSLGLVSSVVRDVTWLGGFACLVLYLLTGESRIKELLESAPMLWSGSRSYSIYVFHFPLVMVLTYLTTGSSGTGSPLLVLVLGLPTALLVAELAHRAVERPSTKRSQAVGRGPRTSVQGPVSAIPRARAGDGPQEDGTVGVDMAKARVVSRSHESPPLDC